MAHRHAPRGKLKAPAGVDPLHYSDPMKAVPCKATNRQGKPCGNKAIAGGTVCRMHGGAAPQVKKAARERLMALQHPALDALEWCITQRDFPSVTIAAAKDVIDRTEGKPTETVNQNHSGELVIIHELPE